MKNNPKISVIIPLYNHELYIEDAIMSVLNQSVPDFELIIINDGSIDNSEDIVKKIHDNRIKYYSQNNEGAVNTINKGIHIACGEYISILNSDDIYDTKRFEIILNCFQSDTSIDAAFSYVEIIDEEGKTIYVKSGADYNWRFNNHERTFKSENNLVYDLLAGNFLHTTSNLFCKKSVFDRVGYFSNLRYTHDYDFFLRLSYKNKVKIIKEPLLKYRLHKSNTLHEDFASSIFETGIVLANFLINYDLNFKNYEEKHMTDVLTKFFNSISTYDTERMLFVLILFALRYNLPRDLLKFNEPDNIFRKACIEKIIKTHDISILKENLAWQKEQTDLWWQKAEELKNQLAWQKEQTDLWWQKAEELKNQLAWQKEQTDLWWQKAEELKNQLAWQKEQTDLWWQKAEELKNLDWWIKAREETFPKLGQLIDKIFPTGTFRRTQLINYFKKIKF